MVNSNVVTQYRAAVQSLLANLSTCRDIELQIASQGGTASFVSGDFAGANGDLTATTFAAIVTSRIAIETLCSANGNAHYTNLMKARP